MQHTNRKKHTRRPRPRRRTAPCTAAATAAAAEAAPSARRRRRIHWRRGRGRAPRVQLALELAVLILESSRPHVPLRALVLLVVRAAHDLSESALLRARRARAAGARASSSSWRRRTASVEQVGGVVGVRWNSRAELGQPRAWAAVKTDRRPSSPNLRSLKRYELVFLLRVCMSMSMHMVCE